MEPLGATSSREPCTGSTSSDAAEGESVKTDDPRSSAPKSNKRSRKTPHKVIEQARRARMNTEFAILQDMLPQPMQYAHKLEILQAAIRYIEYLEDSVAMLELQCAEKPRRGVRLPPLTELIDSTTHDMDDDGPSHKQA